MKKIVIAVPQLTGGGAERVATVWANELSREGLSVSVLAFFPSQNEYFTDAAVNKFYVKTNLDEYLTLNYIQRIVEIRSILKKINADYVVSFLPAMQVWVMFASIGLKCKRVETIRVNPWRISLSDKFQMVAWKACFKTAHRIILQASDQAPFFSRGEQRKSVLIPNPISKEYESNYRADCPEGCECFIAVGRVAPQKNYELMIDAFAKAHYLHPEIRLRIFGAGDDAYLKQLEARIEALNASAYITFMGRDSHMELRYKEADAFLMTSDFEGLPNALMEAMASRLPCISTDCKTGPRDLIDDGDNGLLAETGSLTSVFECICKLVEMPVEQREKMAELARAKAMDYCSTSASASKLIALFK